MAEIILVNETVIRRPTIRKTVDLEFQNGEKITFKAFDNDGNQIGDTFGYLFADIPEGRIGRAIAYVDFVDDVPSVLS